MPYILMPRLSDSMEEGTIVRWLCKAGAEVSSGDGIAEIETDKAVMTYESESSGKLEIVAEEGATLPVGAVIAAVLSPGEELPGEGGPAAGHAPASASGPTSGAAGGAAGAAGAASANADRNGGGAAAPRHKASPVARRIAGALGVDLAAVIGTGPGGRIVKRDVEAAGAAPHPVAPASVGESAGSHAATSAKGGVTVQPLNRTQTTIARRMAEAKATMPEFTLSVDVDMDEAVAFREQLKPVADGVTPSVNDLVVKACGIALRRHPRANGAFRDGAFELFERVNVGVAVAAEDALLVPTVFDVDAKSLGAIAKETRELAGLAREGRLEPPHLAGGTFTVSNLGMFGIDRFTAVLNPPQAAILAVGALALKPAVRDGAVVPSHRMTLTMTCDHRILYGADAAKLLADVREQLEQPLRLTL